MSFANPSAFVWLLLAVPIVVFYILKIRLRRVPVSTVLFWRQIFEEKKPRSIWQILRHLVSLLVQILLLLLFVGALVDPFFAWEISNARRLILVIDNSASMSANDGAPNRLAVAKETGLRVINGLRMRDEMAIVLAGTQPQVICGLTSHQRTLRDKMTAVTASDGPTRVIEAVELARRLVAEMAAKSPNARIIVISDGCFEKSAELAAASDVQFISVGTQADNVGITRFQTRRLLDATGYEVLLEVQNFGNTPAETRLELELNGNTVDVFPLKLEPGKPWTQVVEKATRDGGVLTAKLNLKDALAADNVAYAILPKREDLPVLLVSKEPNLYLERVLDSNPLVKLLVSKEPKPVPSGGIAVYNRTVPTPVPDGPVLVIDPANDTDLWTLGEPIMNPIVTKQAKDSPLMAFVRLDNVLMPEAKKVTMTARTGVQELANVLSGEPIFLAQERPSGKLAILAINIDKGDLPLRTAFPIMVSNVLNWFVGSRGDLRESLPTGSISEIELPTTQGPLTLHSPDGSTRSLGAGGKVMLGPFDQVGLWEVRTAQPDAAPLISLAVNLANPAESDLRVPEGLPSKSNEPSAVAGLLGRPAWFYLALFCFLLIVVEWYLYQRRWIS